MQSYWKSRGDPDYYTGKEHEYKDIQAKADEEDFLQMLREQESQFNQTRGRPVVLPAVPPFFDEEERIDAMIAQAKQRARANLSVEPLRLSGVRKHPSQSNRVYCEDVHRIFARVKHTYYPTTYKYYYLTGYFDFSQPGEVYVYLQELKPQMNPFAPRLPLDGIKYTMSYPDEYEPIKVRIDKIESTNHKVNEYYDERDGSKEMYSYVFRNDTFKTPVDQLFEMRFCEGLRDRIHSHLGYYTSSSQIIKRVR